MDARDLRYENLIKYTNKNGTFILPVIGIFDFHIWVRYNGGIWTLKYDDIEPIPLTDELLLKGGAKKNQLPNGYWLSLTNLKAELHFETFANTDEIVTTIISQSCELILDRIKYAHSLQNLYRDLTGEELNFKL